MQPSSKAFQVLTIIYTTSSRSPWKSPRLHWLLTYECERKMRELEQWEFYYRNPVAEEDFYAQA